MPWEAVIGTMGSCNRKGKQLRERRVTTRQGLEYLGLQSESDRGSWRGGCPWEKIRGGKDGD